MNADERIAAARRWLGVPFLTRGRSKQGIDCVGLALAVLDNSPDVPTYNVRDGRLLIESMRRDFQRVTRAVAGDFLLISPKWGELPQHIALFTGHSIIHSTPRKGCIEQPYRGAWLRLTHSVWRPLMS